MSKFVYEMDDPDELEFALCIYDEVKRQVVAGEAVKLRHIAVKCDMRIADLKDRLDLIARVELLIRRELDDISEHVR